MPCVFMMCLMTVIWAVYGYSLVFGGKQPWIGDLSYLLMQGVNAEWTSAGRIAHPAQLNPLRDDAHDLPGDVLRHHAHPDVRGLCRADEVRHPWSCSWCSRGTLIYCPLAHWLWGNGGPLRLTGNPNQSLLGGAIDFAGGTMVHTSSGVSAVSLCLVLGKRLEYGKEEMQ